MDAMTMIGAGEVTLLQRYVQTRSPEVFALLVERHSALVGSVCRRCLGHANPWLEDARQAVFIVLERKASSIRDAKSLPSWLHHAALRVCAQVHREEARRKQREATTGVMEKSTPTTSDAELMLDEAIGSLRHGQREVFIRHFLLGQTLPTVASELGLSESAAKMRIHDGMERLRAFFKRRGIAMPAAGIAVLLAVESSVTAVTTASSASATASTLAKGTLKSMFMMKFAIGACLSAAVILPVAAMQPFIHNDSRPIARDQFPVIAESSPVPAAEVADAPRSVDANVRKALEYLKSQQNADGSWTAQTGKQQSSLFVTAFATLCFSGAGYHNRNDTPFRGTTQAALSWLLSQQRDDGSFSALITDDAMATRVISEMYAMSNDPTLKAPAQRAVDHLVRQQRVIPGTTDSMGWGNDENTDCCDTMSTLLCVIALRAAQMSGLATGNSLERANTWVKAVWQVAGQDERGRCHFPSIVRLIPNAHDRPISILDWTDQSPAGLGCTLFTVKPAEYGVVVRNWANIILAERALRGEPTGDPMRDWLATLGMFQIGAEYWRAWSTTPDAIVATQQDDGAWPASWGFGIITTTAIKTLTLEIAWRFESFERKP
jgi:RNA polymerase sigma factor (sigma-70 family)